MSYARKKAPPKRGRCAQGVRGKRAFRSRTIRDAEDSSHKGTHGAIFSPPRYHPTRNISRADRRAAGYVDRILKGEKPADLPVLQSTKCEFVINLQAARAIEVEVPNAVQLLADELTYSRSAAQFLRCMSPFLALNGHSEASSRCPLCGLKRTTFALSEPFRF